MDIKLSPNASAHLARLAEVAQAAQQKLNDAVQAIALQAGAEGQFAGFGVQRREDGDYLVLQEPAE